MKIRSVPSSARSLWLSGLCSLGMSAASVAAQASAVSETTAAAAMRPASAFAPTTSAAFVPGERLSAWMLRQTTAFYPEGLVWTVPQELAPQKALRRELLAAGVLTDWLSQRTATGRVVIARPDPRWLQAHPQEDPVLNAGDRLLAGPRPSSVTVLREDGRMCHVRHVPGARAEHYVSACFGEQGASASWAWLVQPDGRFSRVGLDGWNAAPQDEPAPGARVWAPRQGARMPEAVSEKVARFLGTLGPEPEDGATVTEAALPTEPRTLRSPFLSASDWGSIGLLQTPTARMETAGHMRLHVSRTQPYTHYNVIFQPLSFLEAGFRYTTIANRIFGVTDRDFTDKSLDLKVRLWEESTWWPQLAVGIRDLGGTGLFAGEYVVANKRWHDFDVSAGLGWGYLGSRQQYRNPLGLIDRRFDRRPAPDVGQGGTLGTDAFFRGRVTPFAGVQWHTPIDSLALKLEVEGNDYRNEPLNNRFETRSRVNAGVVWRVSPGADLMAGIERGNRLTLGFTLATDLSDLNAAKVLDPARPAFQEEGPKNPPADGWSSTARDLELQTGWKIQAIEWQNRRLLVRVEGAEGAYRQERIERMTAVLHRDAPDTVSHFVLSLRQRGMDISIQTVNRQTWVASQSRGMSPLNRAQPDNDLSRAYAREQAQASAQGKDRTWLAAPSRLSFGIDPYLLQQLGGPDAFLLYQAGALARAEFRFSDSTWVSAAVAARIVDNYDKFKYTAPSDLPRVRTFAREFVTTSRVTLPLLQITHADKLADNHFFSVYGGALESMYAGVGAEWLYRPWRSPVAFGVDVNRVQQRDFRQDFGLRDYKVTTGHATLYWDTGVAGIMAKAMAGQYLAGDRGLTLEMSRRFDNGVVLGAWATKTNVSAEKFGEGSFDKGIYLTLPFDAFLARSSTESATIAWQPLMRDGGARLSRRFKLFDLSSARDWRAMSIGPKTKRGPRTGEDLYTPGGDPLMAGRPDLSLGNVLDSVAYTGREMTSAAALPGWLWAGGAMALATALDKPLDDAARRNPSGLANQFGDVGSALPVAMGALTALSVTGLFGEDEARTGWVASKAAAATLVLNAGLKVATGRARPKDEVGSGQFRGFGSGAASSSFASNHTALAFALATPFAQRYDMPWLYVAAGATGLARIQQREHWFSDVVAGGLMGYAIGNMMSNEYGSRYSPRLYLGMSSVRADWDFE